MTCNTEEFKYLVARGYTRTQLAEYFHCTTYAVDKKLRQLKLKAVRQNKRAFTLTLSMRAYLQEHSYRETAEHFGCTQQQLVLACKKLKLKKNRLWQKGERRVQIETDLFDGNYRTYQELAEKYGVSRQYIHQIKEKNSWAH